MRSGKRIPRGDSKIRRTIAEALERRCLLSATLSHEYAFNFNNFIDNVGSSNGTTVGGATTSGQLSAPGSGSQSSHVNYGSLPSSVLSGLTSGTFEGWFTIGTQQTSARLFMAGESTNDYVAVAVSKGSTGTAYFAYKAPGSSEVDTPVTSFTLTSGTQYYFAATVDSAAHAMAFYLGSGGSESLIGSTSLSTANNGAAGDLSNISFSNVWLGRSLFADPDYNGSVQDFRIYNGALSASQIAADASMGFHPELTNPNPFGVGGSAEAWNNYPTYIPKASQAGAKWLRGLGDWSAVEPSDGTWSWTTQDNYAASAKTNGIYQSGLLTYSTSWLTAQDPNGYQYANGSTELAKFSTYVTNTVNRYKGTVSYWELGNEPENFGNVPPAAYGAIAVAAYNAMKAADPTAQLGLTVASVDLNYIEQAIKAGAADHFNFIIVHPYELGGTINNGQESLYMHIVPTVHEMLATDDPALANAPVWVTEIGETATPGNSAQLAAQAQYLLKVYSMGIAQGFSRFMWFDIMGADPYNEGLLNSSGAANPAWDALQSLTTNLGPNPQYLGWVMLNSKDYGFVFQGASATVMVAWAPVNTTDTVNFGQTVQVTSINQSTGSLSTASVSSYTLTNAAVIVAGVPSSIATTAQANKSLPYPWGGNYTGAAAATVTMGSTNTEAGLHQVTPDSTSTAVTVLGSSARDSSKSGSQSFTIDPNFLSYVPTPIQISVVLSSVQSPAHPPGFNLKYESNTSTRVLGIGWNSVPAYDGNWHTLSWTLSNDEFNADWGYNFSFDSDSTTYSQYYIKSVTVAILAPSAPATPTVQAIPSNQNLVSWTDTNTGQTSFLIDRATNSTFTTGLATFSVPGTAYSYVDSGLANATKYYYRVRAVDSGGASANTSSANATTWAASSNYYLRLASDHVTKQIWAGSSTPTGSPSFSSASTALSALSFSGSGATAVYVDFTNGNPVPGGALTIAGGNSNNSLTLIGSTSADTLVANGTNFTVNSASFSVTNAPKVTYSPNGGVDSVNVMNATVSLPGVTSGAGRVLTQLLSLNLSGAGILALPTAASHNDRIALRIGGLIIDSSSKLDVGGNDLILPGASAQLSTLSGWIGTRIASSAVTGDSTHYSALGIIIPFLNTFDGQTVSNSDVIVKYTYYGDANLDGSVDGSDYSLIDNGFNRGLSGWLNGDFNYSNKIDGSDYSLIDNSYGAHLTAIPSALVAPPLSTVALPATQVIHNSTRSQLPSSIVSQSPHPALMSNTTTSIGSGQLKWNFNPLQSSFADDSRSMRQIVAGQVAQEDARRLELARLNALISFDNIMETSTNASIFSRRRHTILHHG